MGNNDRVANTEKGSFDNTYMTSSKSETRLLHVILVKP